MIHKALEHAASAGKRGAKASRRESLDPKITLSVGRADNVQLNRAFTAENVAQMIINRGRSGTESLRKGDLLPRKQLKVKKGNFEIRVLVDSKKTLTAEIRRTFQNIRKPEDYANVIQEGIRLQAVDRDSAIKRREFLASMVVKAHAFVQSYIKFSLLIPIKNADRNTVIASARKGLLYSTHDAQNVLDLENKLLLQHVKSDYHVKAIVLKSLKLPPSPTNNTIQNKLSSGNVFQRATVYEKVFADLGKNAIPRKGYKWAGVRTRPVSHYYLSPKAHNIIQARNRR